MGARACALHGHIRATQDIDVLIQNARENIEKAILTIREMYPHLKEDLTAEDFYSNVIVKILDEPEIDVSLSAWSVTFDSAQGDIETIVLEDVAIPYLGISSLIKSKDTKREQDLWDIRVLREIQKNKEK